MKALEVKNMSFSYQPNKKTLSNINLSIEKGSWVSILGHNGSGKSTLSKILTGLLTPSEGEVYVNGTLITEESIYEIRKQIGIVFQNPDNQFVGVTVKDDISFGMENLCFSREKMMESINFYASKVGMSDFLDKEPSSLSGGQKQRVAIAGILAMETDILILDEATSMLDPFAREELMDYIKQLHDEGLTIVMITHDIEEALLSDRIICLKEGTIIANDTVSEVLKQTDLLKDAKLELPVSLQIASQLQNKEWEEYLWEYTLKK